MSLKRAWLHASWKLALSGLLIGYLVLRAISDPQFGQLLASQKDWSVLLAALPACLAAVTITILRWHLLVHALGLHFSVGQTLRAGFLGYLANLLPLGLVAGDSLKAVMLIHANPHRKTEAVASVLVDRVLGLYALLLLAAGASLLLPDEQLAQLAAEDRQLIQGLCGVVRGLALLASLGLGVMWIPAVTRSRLWDLLEHVPLVGGVLHRLVGAMRTYRQRGNLLLAAVGISLCVHLLYVAAVVLITLGIGLAPSQRPPVGSIFVIVPPSMIAGALPIGVYEVTITLLFRAASPPQAPPNVGLVIALAYRLIQISIASIGAGYWLAGRREVRALVEEAEVQLPADEALPAPLTHSEV